MLPLFFFFKKYLLIQTEKGKENICVLFYRLNKLTKNNAALEVNRAILQDLETILCQKSEDS